MQIILNFVQDYFVFMLVLFVFSYLVSSLLPVRVTPSSSDRRVHFTLVFGTGSPEASTQEASKSRALPARMVVGISVAILVVGITVTS